MKKKLLTVFVVGLFVSVFTLSAWAVSAHAIVLTFDGNICNGGGPCTDWLFIDQTYGDIAGQLDVIYANLLGDPTAPGLRFWTTDYNDLVNVAWTEGGDCCSIAEIFLRPEAGFEVTLHSFDLGAWPQAVHTTSYTILDGHSNVLLNSGALTIGTGNVHSTFTPNLTSASGIRIQWGPSAYNVGIDNIDFTVAAVGVPEPSTMMLLGSGLIGLIGFSTRRRKTDGKMAA